MIWIDSTLVSPGRNSIYGERIVAGHRVWDPYRSKFAALLMKERNIDLLPEMRVLYLGAAHGTTVSHVADYVDTVYAVEIAPRPMQALLRICQKKKNVVPIYADALLPASYAPLIETVDLLYQDVASPLQVRIALNNRCFLNRRGELILMLKTPCVDSKQLPRIVLDESLHDLERLYTIHKTCWLDPYHQGHAAIIGEPK